MTVRKILFALLLLFSIVYPRPAATGEKENAGVTSDTASQTPFFGNYHALIIGIDEYKEWPPLKTAVKDAEAIQKILVRRYGFSSNNVILRTNGDATFRAIIGDLRGLASRLGEKDNLLIYFTGLGRLDDLTGDGYWIPVEGNLKDTNTWISHSIMTRILSSEKVRCKNIMVIADSCFAETFFKESTSGLSLSDQDYEAGLVKLASLRSRQIVTAGGIEPYMDGPREGHSLFGDFFINALSENPRAIVDLENLCRTILWENVSPISGKKPRVGRFKTPVDKGGHFVLFDREKFIGDRKKQLAAAREKEEQEHLQTILEERKKLEEDRQRLEEEKKAMEEKQKREDERIKIEKEKAETERLAAEQKKSREQVESLLAERKALEAERFRLESEKKALEEKRRLENERINIEKEKIEKERIDEERKKEQAQLAALLEERKKLEEERKHLEAEKRALEEKKKAETASGAIEKPGTSREDKRAASSIAKPVAPIIVLRSRERIYSFGRVLTQPDLGGKILNYEEFNFFESKWHAKGNFANDFVDNGDGTVTDRATGLMWQKGGSDKKEINAPRTEHVERLNRERFAGHDDWRVPTLEELASLLEPEKNKDGLHIDPVFSKIDVCASVDSYDEAYGNRLSLVVDFRTGRLVPPVAFFGATTSTVRAVRSIRPNR